MLIGIVNKDIIYRKIFTEGSVKARIHKIFSFFLKLSLNYRLDSFLIEHKLFTVSKSFLKNKCLSTFRSRSVYRILKLSRIEIRNVFKLYTVLGMKKGSW